MQPSTEVERQAQVQLEGFLSQFGEAPPPPPVDPIARSGDNGGMEARVAKLEAAVEHIQRDIADLKGDVRAIRSEARTDFRLLFAALIATALGLAGIMAKGFGWL